MKSKSQLGNRQKDKLNKVTEKLVLDVLSEFLKGQGLLEGLLEGLGIDKIILRGV
jgi:hypothetical protein